MTAQNVIAQMTQAEYTAWVERGEFPARLDEDRKKIGKENK